MIELLISCNMCDWKWRYMGGSVSSTTFTFATMPARRQVEDLSYFLQSPNQPRTNIQSASNPNSPTVQQKTIFSTKKTNAEQKNSISLVWPSKNQMHPEIQHSAAEAPRCDLVDLPHECDFKLFAGMSRRVEVIGKRQIFVGHLT